MSQRRDDEDEQLPQVRTGAGSVNEPLHCVNHPNVETFLRCNKCGKPICAKCAQRTPVGYRCTECVRAQQRVFYRDFHPRHYLIAAGVALPLSLVAGWLVPGLGWLYAIILGPVAGGAIAQAALWAIRRRRGRYTWLVVCGSIIVGVLPRLLGALFSVVLLAGAAAAPAAGSELGGVGYSLSGRLLTLLWIVIYLMTAVGAAYAWLRPGRRV